MVEIERFELSFSVCKTDVFPITLYPHGLLPEN